MKEQNIDFIINGELYLKRGPEVFNPSSELSELDDKISDIEFDISKENPDFSKLPMLDKYQGLKNMMEYARGRQDYSGTCSFWQLFTDGNEYTLYECETSLAIIKEYNSQQKLNNDFIKLSEFLKKATFVGRHFNRTKSITTTTGKVDRSYMKINLGVHETEYIVLYATQDLFLIKSIDRILGEKYALINSRYTLDGNYEFFGPVYEEYRDTNKVYKEILEQVNGYNKRKGRK